MKGAAIKQWVYMIAGIMIIFMTIGLFVAIIRNSSLENEGIPYSISLYVNSLSTVESGEVVMEFTRPLDVEIKEIGDPDRYETLTRILNKKGYGVSTNRPEGKSTRFFYIFGDTEQIKFSSINGLKLTKTDIVHVGETS